MECIRIDEGFFTNAEPNTNVLFSLVHLGDCTFAKHLMLYLRAFINLGSVKFDLRFLGHNYNRFVEDKYGGRDSKMAVGRIPGERMYIDWVGDQPELLVDPETGEASKVHIFATTLGLSSLIYAEIFLNEKPPNFVAGTVHALEFYGGVTKYLVPDNL